MNIKNLTILKAIKSCSHDTTEVGAVLFSKLGHVLNTGFNGLPRRFKLPEENNYRFTKNKQKAIDAFSIVVNNYFNYCSQQNNRTSLEKVLKYAFESIELLYKYHFYEHAELNLLCNIVRKEYQNHELITIIENLESVEDFRMIISSGLFSKKLTNNQHKQTFFINKKVLGFSKCDLVKYSHVKDIALDYFSTHSKIEKLFDLFSILVLLKHSFGSLNSFNLIKLFVSSNDEFESKNLDFCDNYFIFEKENLNISISKTISFYQKLENSFRNQFKEYRSSEDTTNDKEYFEKNDLTDFAVIFGKNKNILSLDFKGENEVVTSSSSKFIYPFKSKEETDKINSENHFSAIQNCFFSLINNILQNVENTLLVSLYPCRNCLRALIACGIKQVDINQCTYTSLQGNNLNLYKEQFLNNSLLPLINFNIQDGLSK